MQAIVNWDIDVLYWIQTHLRNDLMTTIMKGVTKLGDKGVFLIILILGLVIVKKTRRIGLYFAGSMAVQGIIVNLIIKKIVARPRPYIYTDMLIPMVEPMKDFSYPSGHTCMVAALCFTAFILGYKTCGWILAVSTVLMGFSRLYLGVHYPTDIFGGIVWALVSALISVWIGRKIEYTLRNKRK